MPTPTYGLVTMTPVSANPSPSPVTFTTDPDKYTRTWKKRMSVHQGIEGTVTTQDFGRVARDCQLDLEWGRGQILTKAVVRAVKTWEGVRESLYRFQDWEGNDFTVEILSFQEEAIFPSVDLYTARLSLQVVEMAVYLGDVYTGD